MKAILINTKHQATNIANEMLNRMIERDNFEEGISKSFKEYNLHINGLTPDRKLILATLSIITNFADGERDFDRSTLGFVVEKIIDVFTRYKVELETKDLLEHLMTIADNLIEKKGSDEELLKLHDAVQIIEKYKED